MKACFVPAMAVMCVCMTAVAANQRDSSDKALEIVRELTSRPRRTWIPAGTIVATRRQYAAPKTTDAAQIRAEVSSAIQQYLSDPDKVEQTDELQKMKLDAIPFNVRYRLANEYTMDSTMVVKYDGDRFYWEVSVDSRQDSVTPDSALAGNYMTDQFDPSVNGRRVFAWDGEEYTTYTASGKWAHVAAAGRLPRGVSGPLTAGVIAWGHGRVSYDNLSAATLSATEQSLDGTKQTQLNVTWSDGASGSFTLDPSKAYAVTACTLPGNGDTMYYQYYGGYRQVAGNWVPSTILIECRDISTDKLVSSDQWTLSSIDGGVPPLASFAVQFEAGTRVQYDSPITAEPVMYLHSDSVDTRGLLAERLAYAARQGKSPQNCAMAALDYVASTLGKTIPAGTLGSLVGPDGRTSLRDMKRLAQGVGLYCRAVQTDLAGLEALGPTRAILHLPGKEHFVVLDSIDEGHVRIIDLSNDRFYDERDADFFTMEWSDGVALLISTAPIVGPYEDLSDASLAAITGDEGYTCTRLVQQGGIVFCQPPCSGYYIQIWRRYGCEPAETGSCSYQVLIRYCKTPCVFDPLDYCTITWEWYYAYMIACG